MTSIFLYYTHHKTAWIILYTCMRPVESVWHKFHHLAVTVRVFADVCVPVWFLFFVAAWTCLQIICFTMHNLEMCPRRQTSGLQRSITRLNTFFSLGVINFCFQGPEWDVEVSEHAQRPRQGAAWPPQAASGTFMQTHALITCSSYSLKL